MEAPVQPQPQYPAQDRCSERTFKLLAFAGLLGVLVLIHFLDPGFYHQIVHLARGGNIQETVDFLRSFGPWAVVISFLLDVFINAAGCLPSIFLSTANGVVFGLPVRARSWTRIFSPNSLSMVFVSVSNFSYLSIRAINFSADFWLCS